MQIGLIDQVSKPLGKIGREVDSVTKATQNGMRNMAAGGAGLVAAGFAIQNALMPAIEMDRKMGELASLGTAEDAMDSLKKTAMGFAVEYGKSAEEFVEASYDIQSAIGGLKGNDLANFTKASGVLAAATKSDTKTITNYMGTMYGIFGEDAKKMGNSKWVDQVAGKTARAVQLFKTDGSKMAQSFTSIGSTATAMGASLSEQMAVLGTLSATMGGGEAGTKYRAFITGAIKAQDKLGMSFTDSRGKLMPMTKILEMLDKKYGNLTDTKQAEIFKDAFGSDQAVMLLQNLMPKIGELKNNIEELGKVKGIDIATQMAKKQTDQWERLEQSWYVIRAAIGGAILPGFASIAQAMSDGSVILMQYMNEYPELTKYVGYALMAIVGLGGAVALFSLLAGISSFVTAGFTVVMGLLKASILLTTGVFNGLKMVLLLVNAAFLANPIVWVVGLIAALVAGVVAAIYYWDDLKASFGDTAVFKAVVDMINWVIDMINKIPGIDIENVSGGTVKTDLPEANNTVSRAANAQQAVTPYNMQTAQLPTSSYLQAQKQTNIPVGGIRSQLTNNNNAKNVYMGGVTINNPDQAWDFATVEEKADLSHG